MDEITLKFNGLSEIFEGLFWENERYGNILVKTNRDYINDWIETKNQYPTDIIVNHLNGHEHIFHNCRLVKVTDTENFAITFTYGPTD